MARDELEKALWLAGITRFLVLEKCGEIEIYIRAGYTARNQILEEFGPIFPIGVTVSLNKLPWWKCLFRRKRWVSKL